MGWFDDSHPNNIGWAQGTNPGTGLSGIGAPKQAPSPDWLNKLIQKGGGTLGGGPTTMPVPPVPGIPNPIGLPDDQTTSPVGQPGHPTGPDAFFPGGGVLGGPTDPNIGHPTGPDAFFPDGTPLGGGGGGSMGGQINGPGQNYQWGGGSKTGPGGWMGNPFGGGHGFVPPGADTSMGGRMNAPGQNYQWGGGGGGFNRNDGSMIGQGPLLSGGPPSQLGAIGDGVMMRAPTGQMQRVPRQHVQHYLSQGAQQIG